MLCFTTTRTPKALALWNQRPDSISLLLTDVVMPEGVTGRDLATQLRAQNNALNIVFMSGYSAELAGKDTDFFRHDKSHFLQKPCSSRVLLETIRRCLDEH